MCFIRFPRYYETFGDMCCSVKIILCGFIAVGVLFADAARPRILGGSLINIRSRPFMVSLHTKSGGFICGGSIIDERWVLSAYHCVMDNEKPSNYYVRAGSTFHEFGGTLHRITDLVWVNKTRDQVHQIPVNDILMLKVLPPFRFSSSTWKIGLPLSDEKAPEELWVSGWGMTRVALNSLRLKTAGLDSVDYEKCLEGSPIYSQIVRKDRHLCYARGREDACFGDSGGPLASATTIYGIVSFGDGCGIAPGIYTRVSHFVEWIRTILKSG